MSLVSSTQQRIVEKAVATPAQLNHKFATFLLRRRMLREFECNPIIRSVSRLLIELNELLSRVTLDVWKKLEGAPSRWNVKISCAAMVNDSVGGLVDDAIAGVTTPTLQKLVSYSSDSFLASAGNVIGC